MNDNNQRVNRSVFRILNYPRFQVPVLALILLTAFISFGMMGSFIYIQMKLLLNMAAQVGMLPEVKSILWKYGVIIGGAYILSLLFILVWGLIVTHRMNGPIPRLKNELEKMFKSKEPHLLYVRQNDYLGPLLEKLNKVLLFLMNER